MRQVLAISAAVAMLAGCATKYEAVTPDVQAKMMADLQAGKPVLDCGGKCSFTWSAQAAAIHQLDLAEKWNDLALRVMQIGYGSDLAYYYLGQSAQGLGYHQAAIAYYGWSLGINTGTDPMLKCAGGTALAAQLNLQAGDPCQGVDLAASIPVLIQASRDALAQQAAAAAAAQASEVAPAPVHHYHHVQKTATNTGGSGWVAPPPAASGSSSSNTGGTGWVAPPSSSSGSAAANTGGTGWSAPPPAPASTSASQ
jgi:hypothetical protein